MFRHTVIHDINHNLYLFAKFKFPTTTKLPRSWMLFIDELENQRDFRSRNCQVVRWKLPPSGYYKCNNYASIRNNINYNSIVFCLHYLSERWDFNYWGRLEYFVWNGILPLKVEIDSLNMQKVVNKDWECSWTISLGVDFIKIKKKYRSCKTIERGTNL